MNLKVRPLLLTTCALGLAALAGSLALAQPPKDAKPPTPAAPAGQPEMQLPPGWTAEDMQACVAAGTPGKMHEHLAKGVGTWHGKTQMWMAPGTEPMKSECTSTVTSVMDGRYVKCEMAGEMPGMGPFTGLGIAGYDNVSQKFVGTWIDNQATGIMNGTGELSTDGSTLTWNYTYNCPITKKQTVMRQIETYGSDGKSMSLEMFATDPKSHKEYKCMRIDFTKAK